MFFLPFSAKHALYQLRDVTQYIFEVVAVSYSFYVWSMFCEHIRAEMIVNRQTLSGGSVSYNIIEC